MPPRNGEPKIFAVKWRNHKPPIPQMPNHIYRDRKEKELKF